MARYIDLEELKRRIKEHIKAETPEEKALIEWCKDECIRQGYAMPVADVVPQSEGEWIERTKTTTNAKGMEARYTINFCSKCGYEIGTIRYQHKYCPNCGAKMKGGAE